MSLRTKETIESEMRAVGANIATEGKSIQTISGKIEEELQQSVFPMYSVGYLSGKMLNIKLYLDQLETLRKEYVNVGRD